jgi:transposase-like protein
VTGAAQHLGLHRNQLRRWLARHGVDPRASGEPDESGTAASAAGHHTDD